MSHSASPPAPTVQSAILSRYVLNGKPSGKVEIATFASGCFWGAEYIFIRHFSRADGLIKSTVGYTGGLTENPSYEDVCSGNTGHAEAVKIEFDPALVSYAELVEFFFRTHDPIAVNRQGGDWGRHRSAIFCHTSEQLEIAGRVKTEVQKAYFDPKGGIIDTWIEGAGAWWDAEAQHQRHLFNNPDESQPSTHRLHW
ncbi:hypothetical protein BOTBODRAFT_58459 [Botryobasidium botryosum FD-172 SS1]|uniref:peptide-methionine (S)-S-oxide reductase n=1 Tax=Botryobasidium botryosum (strain FD-172 SS1) TaxID=930990 RepID=A0A067M1Y0_BOTB1|nr:hypothetical protein BOTBODRAFT_58459 [Botryobasidium botryosum FD-172 SS1]